MAFITVACPICQETQVIRYGKNKQGKQRYLCKNACCSTQTFMPTTGVEQPHRRKSWIIHSIAVGYAIRLAL